jgi:hypothetical protein
LGTRRLPVIFVFWELALNLELERAEWLEVFLLGGLVAGGDAPNLKALHSFSSSSGV